MTYVAFETIESFIKDVFTGLGFEEKSAQIAANVLVESDKRGIFSHGVARLKDIYYNKVQNGTIKINAPIEIVKEGPTTAVIDGHDGLGHPIAYKAMTMAIEKAKKYGTSMVVVRNSNHYGIAGYYSSMAVREGLIGFSTTNARPSVSPTNGVENMFGTNPYSWGIPTDEPFEFAFDAASSTVQRGKVEIYARSGKKLPDGWVLDQDGKSIRDPKQSLEAFLLGKAALTPLGGIEEDTGSHKGYGLALAVEILSSALQSGNFLKALSGFDENREPTYNRLGHCFMAYDVSHFVELEKFKKNTGDLLREVRASKPAAGKRVYTAGEKEFEYYLAHQETGPELSQATIRQMSEMRDELGLSQYQKSW